MNFKNKNKLLFRVLIGALVLLVIITGLTIYKRSRPSITYIDRPKTSLKKQAAAADEVFIGKVKQQNKTSNKQRIPQTEYTVQVEKTLKPAGSKDSNKKIKIEKAGGRKTKSGKFFIYHHDLIPLVNSKYIFLVHKDKGRYLVSGPYSTLENNSKNEQKIQNCLRK